MNLSTWVEVSGIAASAVIFGGGAVAIVEYLRHGRHKRRALDEALLGRPASPGFPAQPGLPERTEAMEKALTEVLERLGAGDTHFGELDSRMTAQDEVLAAIKAEMPKNGIPLSAKIDALYRHLIAGPTPPPPVHVHLDQPPATS